MYHLHIYSNCLLSRSAHVITLATELENFKANVNHYRLLNGAHAYINVVFCSRLITCIYPFVMSIFNVYIPDLQYCGLKGAMFSENYVKSTFLTSGRLIGLIQCIRSD